MQASSLSDYQRPSWNTYAGDLLIAANEPEVELASYLERLWIRNKSKQVVNLLPNRAQRHLLSSLKPGQQNKILILKARQLGMSTICQAHAYGLTRRERYAKAVTISHDGEATERLHSMQRFFLERDDPKPPTRYNRLGALEFADTASTHYTGTAGSRSFGRGDTLHFAHCSEFAFWTNPKQILTGLLEALTKDSTVYIESTPNGVGGEFYELWQNAPENGWVPLFFPWWWDDDYRIHGAQASEVLPYREDEEELVTREGLDHEQIAWRREKQKEIREDFKQEYPEDAISCFLASGRPYFTPSALSWQEEHIGPPIRSDGRGLSIWKEFNPEHTYVVGADPAEGLEDGDFSVAQVFDLTASEQVAQLRSQVWPPDFFGKAVCLLAAEYGKALLGIERNNHGHAVLNTAINQMHYPNVYHHEEYDPRQSGERLVKRAGWPTSTVSKPVMLAEMEDALREHALIFHDATTLSEFRTMHWDGKGGVSAIAGCHDDCSMSMMVAWQIRKNPRDFEQAMGYFTAMAARNEAAQEPVR